MRKIAIIYNSDSGILSHYEEISKFCEILPADQFNVDLIEKKTDDDLKEIIEDTKKRNYETIVAAGGDGTLNTVAESLLNTSINFGVIPLGTLNHFAKDMNIPLDALSALKLIVEEHEIVKIDVGKCNEFIFLNNSGLGIYPRIVELREKFQKDGHIKWIAFIFALFRVSNRIPRFFVKIKNDKEEIVSKKTSFIFVGNNLYGLGGISTGKRESLSDGLLSFWISHRTSFLGMAGLVGHAIFGNIKEHRDFDVFESAEFTVETKRKNVIVSFDGEVKIIESPLQYKIEPQCLNVIVPINPTQQ